MYIGLHAKSPLFLSDFEFFGQFSKNTQISDFMKNCQVGAELFHADRQTDRHDEADILFSQYSKCT